MDQEVRQALAQERRAGLLDATDPEILRLREEIRTNLLPAVNSAVNIAKLTESILLAALLYASRDKLSGLSNKNRLRVEVNAAMTVARRLNIPLSVLYMDARHFKEINGKLGHDAGDQVIQAIGEGIQTSTRSTDITLKQVNDDRSDNEPNIEAARDGGDEFAAVLLGATSNGARIVADRIQVQTSEIVNERIPEFQQIIGHPLELTIGMVTYNPAVHMSANDLIKAADANLTALRQQMGQSRRS